MGKRKIFSIRLPVLLRNGRPDFIHVDDVDPSRLHPGVLSDIFEKCAVQGGWKYLPVSMMIPEGVDLTEIQETLQEIRMQWQASLESAGEEGQKLWREHLQELPFETLVTALASGGISRATDALRDILYGLMSATAQVATELERRSTTVSGLDASVTRWEETATKSGELTDDLCLKWAYVAERITGTVDSLAAIERTVASIREDAMREHERLLLRGSDAELNRAREFFDGGATLGFLIEINQHLHGELTLAGDVITARIAEARKHIQACRGWEEATKKRWSVFHTRLGELLAHQRSVAELSGQLEQAIRDWLFYAQSLGPDTIRPYDRDAISQEAFDRAERFVRDPQWSARACRERIGALIDATIGLINTEPGLPEDLRSFIEKAEGMLNRLERSTPTEGLPIPEAQPVPLPKGGAERLEELYRCLLAIGYVLTNRPTPVAQSSIPSLIRIAQRLGWCTVGEAMSLRGPLNERSKRDREPVREITEVKVRWRESRVPWLQYQIGRRWCLKVTQHIGEECLRTLRERNVTETDVRHARELCREESQRRYLERKQKKPLPERTP